MLVCIYICLPFVLYASHNILAWMTLPPVIALGVLLLPHAGEKSGVRLLRAPMFATSDAPTGKFWDVDSAPAT